MSEVKLTEFQGWIDRSTIIVGYFNTPLSIEQVVRKSVRLEKTWAALPANLT